MNERPKDYNLEFTQVETGTLFFGRRVESGQYKLVCSISGKKLHANQRTMKDFLPVKTSKRPQTALRIKNELKYQ